MTEYIVPISIIIPTYNGALYLRDTLDSVINQTFTNFEVIIIDDASDDNTVQIAYEYAKIDSRFIVYQNEVNLGFAGNRNKAIKIANGKYIAWLDQDDISLPDRLELEYNLLESNKKLGMVGGSMEIFDEDGKKKIRRYPVEDMEIRRKIFRYSSIALPACMIRKSSILGVGGYSLQWSPACDLEMTFKIGEHYELGNVPQVVVRYRSHYDSGTKHHLRQIEKDSIQIRFGYAMSKMYQMTISDFFYNVLHYISIWIVPPKLKIWLFNKIRDDHA